MKKIVILEPGAWGTALGILLSKREKVIFWYENPELALKLSRKRESEKLAGVKIPQNIFIFSDLKKSLAKTDLIIIGSPSFSFRKTIRKLKCLKILPALLGIAKGFEKETGLLPSQITEEILGKVSYAHLSGPGFAKEIIQGKEAKEVIACKNKTLLAKLKKIFQIKPLKISTTTDLIGIQIAGAVKNSLAIGISLAGAFGQGPEVQKNLINIGLKEMIKIGGVMGAKKRTFLGPAGLEDLILTATNPRSRNFQFGQSLLFNPRKIRREIKERKITIEGLDSAFALQKLKEIYGLNLPMIAEVYKVIYQKISPPQAVKNLVKLTKPDKSRVNYLIN